MKNQKADNKQPPKKRSIIITILVVAIVGLFLIFIIWLFAGNKPAGEIMSETGTGTENVTASPTNQATVFQNEIAPEEILFSINKKPIPMSVFCYYLYDSFSRLESKYMTNELNFNTDMGEGMNLGQYVIKNSVDGVKFNMALEKLAEELVIDKAQSEATVDEYLTSTIKNAFSGNEDSFREQLALMGTTLESFRDIMISQSLGSQIFEHYYGETWVASVDPSEYYDKFVTASDILLLTVKDEANEMTGEITQTPLSDEEIAQKRELAETILERLKAGEDYYGLLNQYGEDTGVKLENNPEQRYTFQRNGMTYDFANTAFSTEVGEYSDIVEASYGYYIIFRLPLDTEKVVETVKTQEFRSSLFNNKLDDVSKDYTFEPTTLFENASLDNWYREYKSKNYQTFS